MRIAYILTTLGIGGAEKQTISLAERMSARGHVVTLIVLKYAVNEEWPTRLPVMRLNMRKTPPGIWQGLLFAKNFLQMFRPDIVHSHTFPANIFARLLKLSGISATLINTIHNVYEGGLHRMMLYRLTDSLANRVTAVSAAAMDSFVAGRAVTRGRISILTNGIDTQAFSPDQNRRLRTRRMRNAEGAFVWIAVGRLSPAKDYPNLLEAFTQIRVAHPKAVLWIAGEGDVAAVSPLNVSDIPDKSLLFLGLRRDITELLDAADAFVLSSSWEGMPLALGEAMAMEKPAVATNVGGVSELLGPAGFLVPSKDGDALAGAMGQVMAMSAKERTVIGRAARERIKVHFSMDAKATEWEAIYKGTEVPRPV